MSYTHMALSPYQLRELRRSPIGPSGNRVAKAMELLKLRQVDVAAAIKVAQPYVSDVARGRSQTITLENAYKFAAFFGTTVEELFPMKTEQAA